MTPSQFSELIKKKNQWKFIFEIIIALVVVVPGILFFYKLCTSDWFERGKPNIYAFAVGVIALGIWGIRKVTRNYRVVIITTELNKNENEALINIIADNLNWALLKSESMIEYVGNTHALFGYSYDIRILAVDKEIYLDIQSISIGIIDFGDKRRLIKKIRKEIAAARAVKENMTRTTALELDKFLTDNEYYSRCDFEKVNEIIIDAWDNKLQDSITKDLNGKIRGVEIEKTRSLFDIVSDEQGASIYKSFFELSYEGEKIEIIIKLIINHDKGVIYLGSRHADKDHYAGQSKLLGQVYEELKKADKQFGYFIPVDFFTFKIA